MTLSTSDPENRYMTPLRGLNEFVYCPRLFHLMYVQEQFEENVDTLEGSAAHRKRLTKTKAGSIAKGEGDASAPWPNDLVRKLSLSSDALGIVGKFDVVIEESGELIPVEVKRGAAPDGAAPFQVGPHQLMGIAWPNDQVQLAGQIALLREVGYRCTRGRLYYQKTRSLVEVPWEQSLIEVLLWVTRQTQEAVSSPMPEPLEDSNKCIRCSLNHVCLPDETLCLKGRADEPRQLYPGRDDLGLLHVITPGTQIGKCGETVKISVPDEKACIVPIKDIAHVCCWGNVQISTQAIIALINSGIGISWLTGGGWLRAMTTAPLEKNVHLRRSQYRNCDDAETCLRLSQWVVTAKIENQRILLRRNAEGSSVGTSLTILRRCRNEAGKADCMETLRGIEGYAARVYWDVFSSLLHGRDGIRPMKGRNRRPPKDPVNALLSFGYTMLMRDFMTALHGAGMDPLYGFYHAVVPGRPALALDLMETFRPLVVDSAVLRVINEGTLAAGDFVQADGFCALKPTAKARWIKAYERRVDEMVTHPVFGYRLSYRRIFSLESRLLGRFFTGEIQEYHPLTTR